MADTPGADADSQQDAMGIVEAVGAQPGDLRCCCGREECVFLRHNCSVLLSVERDVHTAAKMGQTLLARHEAYMASAERDRLELTARIEQLEHENAQLEVKNKSVTDENNSLREELEQLNDTVKDAETKIELLEATLRDSQREVRRLENTADRAANLERQIAMLEEEQVVLQNTIVRTQEEARTAMYRWRQAEKGLSDLQEQLERMEKEAREERERHLEVISRMERQRNVERELNLAAGRLKGAAAVKSMTDSKSAGNVVSHFVRDLLQDNANLQLGIAELREMLLSSNDEIQMLREQLMYHQPAASHDSGSPATLQAELDKKEPASSPQLPRVSQELHIHHHYHVTHRPDVRKPRKKRQGVTPGTFTPPHGSAPGSPITSPARWQRGVLKGPLSPPAASHPSVPSNGRWSLLSENQSEFAPSSAPSSPQSVNIFDRAVVASSPSSPTTSVDPASPGWKNVHQKKASEFSFRSIAETVMFPTNTFHPPSSLPAGYPPPQHPLTHIVLSGRPPSRDNPSAYTTDDVPSSTLNAMATYSDFDSATTEDETGDAPSPRSGQFDPRVEQRPRGLRRVVSHESIMSLSNGLDIHTLKARPSQLTLRPLGLTAAGTNVSAITARPTLSSGRSEGKRGSVILRDNLVSARGSARTVSSPVRSRDRSSSRAPSALGKLVSWRPWGGNANTNASANPSPEVTPSSTPVLAAASPAAIPTPAPAPRTSTANISKSPLGSVSSTATTFRAPGINQPGAVPGFHEYWAAHQRRGPPSKVSVEDQEQVQEALREVLEDS
ncbi:hypothetical protein VTK56DRAFT_5327 [Thermocarpiscus australiensis]